MFKRFFKTRPEQRDAQNLYNWAMTGARQPDYYVPGGIEDSYDGRIEFLFLHLGLILHHLRRFGPDGEVLSQSLYDVMIADFDVALREQGIADTGVQRRIKAMVRLFYGRAKLYHEAASEGDDALVTAAHGALLPHDSPNPDVQIRVPDYTLRLHRAMQAATLADFQNARLCGDLQ
ncbi:ubiquinol-cytochrome C chaperone family protein [Robiginitomaculum antarcticum]|uniref:ubiquinol-cytochrome C chaperone family protein n=1 Tax=Robiginitomaculum antarcticum TaxID=437507 RepID=UPI0003A7F3DC|nr:ubiquinol-cytochrome C chaperone family protein [Robiginitomaculum antarcticum]